MNTAILLAAGSSTRAGQDKLWADVHAKPLWTLSHQTLLKHPKVDRVILVVPKGQELRFLPFIKDEKTTVAVGGATRMASFKQGLKVIQGFNKGDIILDHNAANPFVTEQEITAVIESAQKAGASAVAHPVVDTLLESRGPNLSIRRREDFHLMQTPQAVRGDILAKIDLQESTDLSTALLPHTEVHILPAHPLNKKITFAEDLLTLQGHSTLGEDSHHFSNEGQLTLGGLTVSDCPAMEANSDGDVILHAIGRALATAQNKNFSELADPLALSGGRDSRDYLEPLLGGRKILEVSLSIEGARPKIDPLIPDLKKSLGKILQLDSSQIHICAHTGEDLTPFGKGEGLRCLALLKTLPQ